MSLALVLLLLSVPIASFARQPGRAEFDSLVTRAELSFLLHEIGRVQPPERLRELADYGRRQLELGGGFYGLLPDQLVDRNRIPVPSDSTGRYDAALHLARQRRVNLEGLREMNPDYALDFRGDSLAGFLDRTVARSGPAVGTQGRLRLSLDTSALDGFFAAMGDGEIGAEEAAELAALPSNQAMLQHRRNLGYVPEPLPDTDSLAEMIAMAGSADPLDRLWCWINPQNAFGYADLVQNARGYARLLSDLNAHREELAQAVLAQIEGYTPLELHAEARFAFTVGWAIRGWATPEMAGLNLEQVKDDWRLLFGTLVEETYHRLQLQICASPTGRPAREFSDLATVETGEEGYDRLYEIISYTVLEGTANLVRGRFAAPDLEAQAASGAELLSKFVDRVVDGGDLERADALLSQGLMGNGPLYGLGWKLAALIEKHDGKRAVAGYQARGPVHFFLRGAALAEEDGPPLLTQQVVAAVERLEERLLR